MTESESQGGQRKRKRRRTIKPKGEPSKYLISLVPPAMVSTIWPGVEKLLEPAIKRSRGRWTMESLFQVLSMGHQHLWVVMDPDNDNHIDGVATTQITDYPARRMLTMQYLGGKGFDDWFWSLQERFDSFARDAGCSGIEGTARHGFWRWLEEDGYDRAYTVYEKRID